VIPGCLSAGTYDIELIAPHKCNRKRLTQDGRRSAAIAELCVNDSLPAALVRRLVMLEYHAENFLEWSN